MQTEKAKSSHFDRTRGDKNQIFPTLVSQAMEYLKIFMSQGNAYPSKPYSSSTKVSFYMLTRVSFSFPFGKRSNDIRD